jgi:hypothetical protein
MIRQQFIVTKGLWQCAGCGAAFFDGVVEHPAGCPQMAPVRCKHELVLESCSECTTPGPRSAQADSTQQWSDMHYVADRSGVPRYGPWIEARYNGYCGGCGGKISEGERIRADDELGEFVCESCGSKG